jgi:2-phosphosulfolactate phosphatase
MTQSARVFLLPSLAEDDAFQGRTVVVVDILRATTTIVHALAAGATAVVPMLDVEAAREKAHRLESRGVLGGERGGKKIEGFDLGNSPAEYTLAAVQGKTVVFTTTNGTKAMQLCRSANRVLIGAFSCFSAICRELGEQDQVDILCAGTDGQITREDVLFAGAVIDDLTRSFGETLQLNDQAEIAADAWRNAKRDFAALKPLAECLRASQGGRNLLEIGHERDIEIAAQIDKFNFVAELDLAAWWIVRK